jgi:glycosyltransferase involved in cell wall biosynthesis
MRSLNTIYNFLASKMVVSTQETEITLGLCVKNSEKTIERCLRGIFNQNYSKDLIKLIIVDGKSKDKTIQIAKKLLSSDDSLAEFYSDEGKGLGTARQIVLDNACGKYIIWTDADAIISENFAQSQVDFMEKNPKVAVATGMYCFKKDEKMTLPALLVSLGKCVGSNKFKKKQQRGLPPNDASVYRIEAARQVGGFDAGIKGASEDEDIMLRMRRSGWLISVNPNAEFYAYARETWRDLWNEAAWFGYGQHYLEHKYKGLHMRMYHIPLIAFYVGLRLGVKAYSLTSIPESFLLSCGNTFMTIAWWFGFLKADFEGYGHKN